MIATMSLDSASSQVRAPFHRPTSTVQTIGTRWAVAAGHSLAAEAAAQRARARGATPSMRVWRADSRSAWSIPTW